MPGFLDNLLVSLVVISAIGYLAWFYWNIIASGKRTDCSKGDGKCCGK